MEATAQAIWGEEVPIVHEDAGHWTWHETEGVYTPPHMGIGSEVLPYPHSITQMEDGWTAEVSYLLMNMGGVSGTTEEYQQEWIPLYEDLDSDSRVLAPDGRSLPGMMRTACCILSPASRQNKRNFRERRQLSCNCGECF